MALIKCPECGNEIGDKECRCPICGASIKQNISSDDPSSQAFSEYKKRYREQQGKNQSSDKNQKKNNTLSVVILVLLLIGSLVAKFWNPGTTGATNTKEAANQEFNSHVINCAKTEVSKILKSPSTAIYGASELLGSDGYDRYLVYVSVEAMNGFGGYKKYDFMVIVADVDPQNGKYSVYTGRSLLDISSSYSCVTKLKNGEVVPLVESFLTLNHWGEAR